MILQEPQGPLSPFVHLSSSARRQGWAGSAECRNDSSQKGPLASRVLSLGLDLVLAKGPFRSMCHPVDIINHLMSFFCLLHLSLAFVCVFCSGTFPIKKAIESHPKTLAVPVT